MTNIIGSRFTRFLLHLHHPPNTLMSATKPATRPLISISLLLPRWVWCPTCSCQLRHFSINSGRNIINTTPVGTLLLPRPKFGILRTIRRSYHQKNHQMDEEARKRLRMKSTVYYFAALGVITVGASYAAVPLYRIFCASYSYGGTTSTHAAETDLSTIKKFKDKQITIRFFADKSSSMQWNFRPQQSEIIVSPGETALAFYRAENRTSVPVDGISTYNVIPFEAGQYFNKIQCFCFEEQRLNPGETVELPVFFYIDPEFVNDPKMETVHLISLSYTFFESKEMPGFNLQDWLPQHGSKKDNSSTTSPPSAKNNNASPVNYVAVTS